jgi:hypothetical protein
MQQSYEGRKLDISVLNVFTQRQREMGKKNMLISTKIQNKKNPVG